MSNPSFHQRRVRFAQLRRAQSILYEPDSTLRMTMSYYKTLGLGFFTAGVLFGATMVGALWWLS